MEYRVSARRWRPQTFDEVVGQNHVARTLKNAIAGGRVGSGYIFSGMRGVGKTTMARILAKALNCDKGPTPEPCGVCDPCREITEGTSMDVIEIDAASNRGIDEIRELRENIKYSPIGGRRKIYIIDEVHMLTEPAFNALLKTLEEPPAHAVFILATTELRKIPATILSRCQHFQFHRIPFDRIVRRLAVIAEKEGLSMSPESRIEIARASEGSLRDALSLLDQVSAFGGGEIRDEDVGLILGKTGIDTLLSLAERLAERDVRGALLSSGELERKGHDLEQIGRDCAELFRDLAIAKTVADPSTLVAMAPEALDRLKTLSAKFSYEELLWFFSIFSDALTEMRGPVRAGIVFEMALVRACRIGPVVPVEELIERAEALERRLAFSPAETVSPSAAPREHDRRKERGSPVAALSEDSTPSAQTSDRWMAFLAAVKERRPNLGSYLEQGELIRVTERELVIGFPESAAFLIGLLDKAESRTIFREIVPGIFGASLNLKFEAVSRQETIAPIRPAERNDREREQRQRMIDDVLDNPAVQEVLNMFGGEVVDVKKHPDG